MEYFLLLISFIVIGFAFIFFSYISISFVFDLFTDLFYWFVNTWRDKE